MFLVTILSGCLGKLAWILMHNIAPRLSSTVELSRARAAIQLVGSASTRNIPELTLGALFETREALMVPFCAVELSVGVPGLAIVRGTGLHGYISERRLRNSMPPPLYFDAAQRFV
jgi:hypothetical protein